MRFGDSLDISKDRNFLIGKCRVFLPVGVFFGQLVFLDGKWACQKKTRRRQSHDYGLKFGKGVNEINLGKERRYGLHSDKQSVFTFSRPVIWTSSFKLLKFNSFKTVFLKPRLEIMFLRLPKALGWVEESTINRLVPLWFLVKGKG